MSSQSRANDIWGGENRVRKSDIRACRWLPALAAAGVLLTPVAKSSAQTDDKPEIRIRLVNAPLRLSVIGSSTVPLNPTTSLDLHVSLIPVRVSGGYTKLSTDPVEQIPLDPAKRNGSYWNANPQKDKIHSELIAAMRQEPDGVLFQAANRIKEARYAYADAAYNRRQANQFLPPRSGLLAFLRDSIGSLGDLKKIQLVAKTGNTRKPIDLTTQKVAEDVIEQYADWVVNIYAVRSALVTGSGVGSSEGVLRMAEVQVDFDIHVEFDPTKPIRAKFFEFTEVNPAEFAAEQPEAQGPPAGKAPPAPAAPKGATPAVGGAAFAEFLIPGVDAAALATLADRPTIEFLGGFGVRDDGSDPVLGIGGYFRASDSVGLMFGKSTNSGPYLLGVTGKVGQYVRPFIGGAFGNSQHSTRSSAIFGAAISLNDIFAGAPKTKKKAVMASVKIDQPDLPPGSEPYSRSTSEAVAYLAVDPGVLPPDRTSAPSIQPGQPAPPDPEAYWVVFQTDDESQRSPEKPTSEIREVAGDAFRLRKDPRAQVWTMEAYSSPFLHTKDTQRTVNHVRMYKATWNATAKAYTWDHHTVGGKQIVWGATVNVSVDGTVIDPSKGYAITAPSSVRIEITKK
jgi:hypothetical protein